MDKMKCCRILLFILIVCLFLSSCSESDNTTYSEGYDEEEQLNIYDYCIPASEAIDHVGEEADVVGYVVSWASPGIEGDPLFINLEADYPDESRFQVVLWDNIRYEYSEDLGDSLLNKTIVVHGVIENYDGVAQITLDEEGYIEEADDFLDSIL